MKKLLLGILVMANVTVFAQIKDSTTMGAGYANDVYYSFATGVEKIETRDNWHMAFTTKIVDASVLINEGLGVELFIGSNDTSDWATVDTTNLGANLHNSPATWTEGAFNDGAIGHPDYGWGDYNNITHNLSGTKIFLMKLPDGSFKKVFIKSMVTSGDFTFKIADLDGSNLVEKTINKMTYSTKNFFYYDVVNDVFVDREPAKTSWDILFTRYLAEVAPAVYYPVMGVLLNNGVKASKAYDVDTAMVDWSLYPTTDSISVIGSDWKSFGAGWSVDDSTACSVEAQDGNLYKLTFRAFGGSANGKTVFVYSVASAMGLADLSEDVYSVYPNPATSNVYVNINEEGTAELVNLTGAVVLSENLSPGENSLQVGQLTAGIYLLRISSNGRQSVLKIVIQ